MINHIDYEHCKSNVSKGKEKKEHNVHGIPPTEREFVHTCYFSYVDSMVIFIMYVSLEMIIMKGRYMSFSYNDFH